LFNDPRNFWSCDDGLGHTRDRKIPLVYGNEWNLTRTNQSDPHALNVMELNRGEADDKAATLDSEEDDNLEDDVEQDPKVLLGRKIYNYNKQVDAELFRLQLKEVRECASVIQSRIVP